MQKFLMFSSAICLICVFFVSGTTSISTSSAVASATEGVDAAQEVWKTENLANNEISENANKSCLEIGEHCKSGAACCSKRCLTYAGKCVS